MDRQVAHDAQDMGGELAIAAHRGKGHGALEELFGCIVATSVMRHPPGHLGQDARRREDALVMASFAAPKSRGATAA